MHGRVDTKNPRQVERVVKQVYCELYPNSSECFVSNIFTKVEACFKGEHPRYQAIDVLYHDLEHTLQGALCMALIIRGRELSHANPPILQRNFELGLFAILLHDTGYLKIRGDLEGTGAKYTMVHVSRSAEFAKAFLAENQLASADEILRVQSMIRCTGVNVSLSDIPFENEADKLTGYALGTADLLGQMAACDYVEKLPVLFKEFEEAAEYNARHTNAPSANAAVLFKTPEELIEKTPGFWTFYVKEKIEKDFLGLYHFLNSPYPNGPNPYINKISENMLKIPATTTNP